MEETIDPIEEKTKAKDEILNRYSEQAKAEFNGQITDFNEGMEFEIPAQDGMEAMVLTIAPNQDGVIDNGDGTVNVVDEFGNTFSATKEDLQNVASYNAYQAAMQRREQALKERSKSGEDETASEEVQTKGTGSNGIGSQVKFNDLVELNENGERLEGRVVEVSEDGFTIELYQENEDGDQTPVGVRQFKPQELDEKLQTLNGKAVEKPQTAEVPEQQGVGEQVQPQEQQIEQPTDTVIGRAMTQEEAKTFVPQMEEQAEEAPEIELTPENWIAQFGEDGLINTPIGQVKMGENQYFKLAQQGRNGKLGMTKPTLQNPNVIIEDYRPATEGNSERDTSYVFVKTFTKRNGERYYYFTSVTVRKDGREVVISNQERSDKRISKLLQQGNVAWINGSLHPTTQVGKSVSLNGSNNHTKSDNGVALLGVNPSTNGKDTTIQPNGEESAENIQEEQQPQPTALSRIPTNESGELIYEQAESPDVAFDAIVEQTEGDEQMAIEVAKDMIAVKNEEAKKLEKEHAKNIKAAGANPNALIAAKQQKKRQQAEIERIRQEAKFWENVANTPVRRQTEANAASRRAEQEQADAERIERERIAAEQAEQGGKARGEINGVPDITEDTPQDARARGFRRVNGYKVERQGNVDARQGKEVEVKFAKGVSAKGRVAVIDAPELQPSHLKGQRNPLHFIDEAQPKERNDAASITAAEEIARDIRPEEVTSSTTAYTGAPSVNSRGEVIQGNNRAAALKLMHDTQKEQAAKYKDYLKEHAQEFGLSAEEIDAMENPVLVNVLDVSDDKAIELGQYVAQDTESGGTERIKPKNTVMKMGAEMKSFANLLLNSSDEEASISALIDKNGAEVLQWMSRKGFITPTQYASAFTSKGYLTDEAKNDLKGIMYQSIFQNGNTLLEEMFATLPAKAQKAILATAFRDFDSAEADRMIGEIQASIRAYYALQQREDFAGAKSFEDVLKAVDNWSRQYDMDDATGESYLPSTKFSNFALHLAAMYKGRTQKFLQDTFNQMYDLIQGTVAGDLFREADTRKRTLAEAIKEVLNIEYNKGNGQNRSNVLGNDTQTSTDWRRGSDRDTGSIEQNTETERTADSASGAESDSEFRRETEKNTLSKEDKEEVVQDIQYIDPRTMSDEEKQKRGEMLRNTDAVEVKENAITSTKELSARKAAEKWWDENVSTPLLYDTEVGEVEINKNSIESSLAHRYSQAKLDAITGLADGFENAVYLGTMPDFTRQEDVLNHYFAFPISYKGEIHYVFCRAMQDANKNRLYVHEVFVADKIKKGDTLQTAAFQPHGGISLYRDILANVLNPVGKGTTNQGEKQEGEADTSADSELNSLIDQARAGDKQAQADLQEYGIDWGRKGVYRFAAKGEVDSILSGGRYMGRFGNGRVDATNSQNPTTASTGDYRITFKDGFDFNKSGTAEADRAVMKNAELGDGYVTGGYSLADVARIEERQADGTYRTVYDSAETIAAEQEKLQVESGKASMTKEQQKVFDSVMGMLSDAGVEVETLTNEQMEQLAQSGEATLDGKKKSPETITDHVRFMRRGADRWDNSGYTEREDGTKVSYRALWAERDGTFSAGTFRKEYNVSKKDFDLLLALGIIVKTEWHHTGKSFRETDYYSWADSDRNNGNIDYSIDDNGVRNYDSNSLAGIYKANKKEISKLAKEYEDKKFEYKEKRKKLLVPTFDYFFESNVFVHLTEKEEDEKRQQHDFISTEGKEQGLSSFDRYVEHEQVDRYYNEILQERKKEAIQDERERSKNRQKYEEEFGESIAKNAEIEAENALIDEHNASLDNSKEATLLHITQIMGIDQEQAKQKVESISDRAQREERIKELEKQRDEQVAKIEEKIDKLIAKNKANGKIVERTRIKEKPELFETSKEEMNGRYGWFEASSTYRLPIYYSGLEFLDKNVYKKYIKLLDEKFSTLYKRPEFNIETDENNEQGTVYGAAVGNTIYLNGEQLNPETPIHEYTHLWDEACRKSNPELWQRGVELMKQTPLWEEVKNDPNYAGLDEDGIASEVHSRLTGKNGAERLEEIVSKSKSKGAVSAAKAVSLKEQLKQWLSDFWYWVKDTFTPWTKEEADRVSLEDFINMPLKDLALGTDLRGNGMTAEENRIIEQAKAEGTYMKAPNGKPTNLSKKKWAQVRTKAFKEWFGDWEKAARIDAIDSMRPISVNDNAHLSQKEAEAIVAELPTGENKRDGRKVDWVKSSIGKILRHKGFDNSLIIPKLKEIFDNSVHISSEREIHQEGHKEHSNFKGYHNYVGKIELAGKEYYVRFTLQEINTKKKDVVANQLHSAFVSDVEIISADTRVNTDNTSATTDNGTVTDAKLGNFLEQARKAKEDSSKVVDENGEPLVVYHGTPLSRNQITPNRGWHGDNYVSQEAPFHTFRGGEYSGLIFMSVDHDKAQSIAEKRAESIPDDEQGNEQWTTEGYVYYLYANIKNPFDPKDINAISEVLNKLGDKIPTLSFYGGKGNNVTIDVALEIASSERNSWILTETPEFLSKIKELGYDGLVGYDEWVKYIAAFSPNQIKSATDNIGTFDKGKDDIRFSISESRNDGKRIETPADEDVLLRGNDDLNAVNARFNEELERLNESNADSVQLNIGYPSEVLLACEIPNRSIILYGNKLVKKAKQHGYSLGDVKDLPKYIANPIAVFKGSYANSFALLTTMPINGKNALVSIDISKGEIQDVNLVTSVFDKNNKGIIDWINKGKMLYARKEKVLDYLSSSAPIADATSNQELFSAAKVVKDFENPISEDELFREGEFYNGMSSDEIYDALNEHSEYSSGAGNLMEALENYYGGEIESASRGARNAIERGLVPFNGGKYSGIDQEYHHIAFVDEEGNRKVEAVPFTTPEKLRETTDIRFRSREESMQKTDIIESMRQQVEELAEKLHLDNVEIVESGKELSGNKARAKGFYNKKNGKITIVLSNNTDVEDAVKTLLHEAVAHHGLRELFGKDFDRFLDEVFQNADADIRRKITDAAVRKYHFDFHKATEEYLASLAESTDFERARKNGWWQKIKDFFISMFEKLGVKGLKGTKLSDNELRYILWKSYENLKTGGKNSILNVAADISKQYELGVGAYENIPEVVNRRFNDELEQQINGTLPKRHVYRLGMPSDVLRAAGVPNLPIELTSSRLEGKSKQENHPFDLSNVKNLPKALEHPIAIFEYGDKNKAQNVIVEIEKNGKKFVVGIHLNQSHNGIEINSVRGIFPKDSAEWLNWISQGKMLYCDKGKIQALIDQQRINLADVEYLDLDTVAKIVQNFENPSISEENDVMFRDGSPEMHERTLARQRYEQEMKSGMFQTQEALQDSMLSLKKAMLMIDKEHKYIEDIAGFENAYLGENRLSSVNKAEADAFARLLFKPMLNEVAKLAHNKEEREQLTDYMFAKHGLERNRVMRDRDTENPNRGKTDYAGLTALTGMSNVVDAEIEAQRMVDEYENEHNTQALWRRVNEVSSAILSKLYECGMMSKKTYDKISSMYDYYIPLRGFDEKTSDDAYAYLSHRQSAFNAPFKKAEGRKSKADDPFAYLQAMAESAIIQGNRNKLVKQKFLNFVLNHPSDLVSVSDLWIKYDDITDEWVPVFPDNIETDELFLPLQRY